MDVVTWLQSTEVAADPFKGEIEDCIQLHHQSSSSWRMSQQALVPTTSLSPVSRSRHRNKRRDTSSSYLFERRPRAKPRPDRYEPYARERRRRSKHVDRKTPKATERRRNKPPLKPKTLSNDDLMESFRAKNVDQARLTLEKQLNCGLFKRGRASSPQRGRNPGLSDVVFDETKFLSQRTPREQVERPEFFEKRDPQLFLAAKDRAEDRTPIQQHLNKHAGRSPRKHSDREREESYQRALTGSERGRAQSIAYDEEIKTASKNQFGSRDVVASWQLPSMGIGQLGSGLKPHNVSYGKVGSTPSPKPCSGAGLNGTEPHSASSMNLGKPSVSLKGTGLDNRALRAQRSLSGSLSGLLETCRASIMLEDMERQTAKGESNFDLTHERTTLQHQERGAYDGQYLGSIKLSDKAVPSECFQVPQSYHQAQPANLTESHEFPQNGSTTWIRKAANLKNVYASPSPFKMASFCNNIDLNERDDASELLENATSMTSPSNHQLQGLIDSGKCENAGLQGEEVVPPGFWVSNRLY